MHLRYSRSHQNVMYRLAVFKLLCNILPWAFYKHFFDISCNKGKSTNIKGKPELYFTKHTFQRNAQGEIWLITLCVCVCLFLCFPNTIMKQSIWYKTNINGNRRNVGKTEDQGKKYHDPSCVGPASSDSKYIGINKTKLWTKSTYTHTYMHHVEQLFLL